MVLGKISKLLPLNGYGFIRSVGLPAHTRFDCSVVEGTRFEDLQEGQEVEFLLRGADWTTNPQAICVRPLPSTNRIYRYRPRQVARP